MTIVQDSSQLIQPLEKLLNDSSLRQSQGQQAKQVVERNRGALDRLMNVIDELC